MPRPCEVEEGLTRPIEAQLNGLEGVSRLESTTFDGGLSISIEANSALPVKDTIDRIRTALRSVSGLPKEASAPTVERERSWNRVMLVAIYGTEDMDRLQNIAADFRSDLLRTGKVSRITGGGLLTKEIVLEFSPAMLQARNIAAADIVAAVRAAGVNGRPAVNLNIMYTNSEDVLTISEAVDALITEASARYGDDITIEPMIRESDQIEERLGTLRNSGLVGLILVVLVLGVFLNFRLSSGWPSASPSPYYGTLLHGMAAGHHHQRDVSLRNDHGAGHTGGRRHRNRGEHLDSLENGGERPLTRRR